MKKFRNANHCPECYERKVKETEDRERLYKFLCEYFKLSFPSGLMLKQIKQFREERNYTYKNIQFTVDYIVRIKKLNLQVQYGIALVPHYYDEMIRYYKDLKERREKTVIKEVETKTVIIKVPTFENKYRERKFINMEGLINDN